VYHRCVIDDQEEAQIDIHFDATADFIQTHIMFGHRVLVHCQAGISRSSAICMYYLMKYLHLSVRGAYALVKSARPCIFPNNGFLKQLDAAESRLSKAPTSDNE
jgi:protein-tyrosine phosphatase